MARYIDADLLMKEFEIDTSKKVMDFTDLIFGIVGGVIKKQPTADVVEVKDARWKGAGMGGYYCSLCQ